MAQRQQPQGQQIIYAQPPQGQQVIYVQAPQGQSAQGQVVYVQQAQQAPETKHSEEPGTGSNNKNKKKSKGFMSKVFGSSPQHIMNETEAVIGKKSTDSLKKGAKDAHSNLDKEMVNVGNQFNKEINGAFNSMFGMKKKKKKKQPQQQSMSTMSYELKYICIVCLDLYIDQQAQPQVVYAQQPQVVYVQQPQQGQQVVYAQPQQGQQVMYVQPQQPK